MNFWIFLLMVVFLACIRELFFTHLQSDVRQSGVSYSINASEVESRAKLSAKIDKAKVA